VSDNTTTNSDNNLALSHHNLLESLDQQSREFSTRTVLFHHLIGERLGLNPTDHKCLDVIIRTRMPMTASQLAEETGLSTGAITGVVDRLAKAGYVRRKRDPNDRRLIFIDPLLDKAMIKMGPIFEPIKQASRNLYSKYADHELKLILGFITNSNKMTQEMTYNLKMKRAAK
jgi:DNA-binding MarR family transcriptional regulator